jgi:hypothetical protein
MPVTGPKYHKFRVNFSKYLKNTFKKGIEVHLVMKKSGRPHETASPSKGS